MDAGLVTFNVIIGILGAFFGLFFFIQLVKIFYWLPELVKITTKEKQIKYNKVNYKNSKEGNKTK